MAIRQHLMIVEADYGVALSVQPKRSCFVTVGIIVNRPINFNDQFSCAAGEIDGVLADRHLAGEFVAA
ncbi:MAG: hypothetical protein AAF903_01850 [Pseudomonadota bacterium]